MLSRVPFQLLITQGCYARWHQPCQFCCPGTCMAHTETWKNARTKNTHLRWLCWYYKKSITTVRGVPGYVAWQWSATKVAWMWSGTGWIAWWWSGAI